jgi:hypothetical protein
MPALDAPPVVDPDLSAVERATKPDDVAPAAVPVAPSTPGSAPAPAEKRKRGQRGPDRRPRVTKKAGPAEFRAAKEAKKAATVPPMPTGGAAMASPDAVARVARGLSQLARMVGNIASATLDVSPVSAQECDDFGTTWAEIAAPHMGEGGGDALKYVTAGAVTLGIVLPRVAEVKKRRGQLTGAETVEAREVPASQGAALSGPVLEVR